MDPNTNLLLLYVLHAVSTVLKTVENGCSYRGHVDILCNRSNQNMLDSYRLPTDNDVSVNEEAGRI